MSKSRYAPSPQHTPISAEDDAETAASIARNAKRAAHRKLPIAVRTKAQIEELLHAYHVQADKLSPEAKASLLKLTDKIEVAK
jgi:hypothetical protein